VKISVKRFTALAAILFHLVSFSIPQAFADGWVVTDIQGNAISASDGHNTQINALGGNTYRVLSGDIGADQTVNINIVDPQGLVDSSARAIFEFADGRTSTWSGALNLNGVAAFINQFGFDIAASFQGAVNGGAIVSTLGINSAEFFAGTAELSRGLGQDTALISNRGHFNLSEGSFLALVASAVQNEGDIVAHGGAAVLAAGDRVTLDISGGNGLISVAVDEPVSGPVVDLQGNRIESAINNSGVVKASGGVAIFSAKASEQVFDQLINHSGIVEANSISNRNGQILLDGGDEGVVSVTGTLRAKGDDDGETGGVIHVLGEKVGLFEGATIDASGYSGGGEVLIGGDYQGLGPVHNAAAVYVDKWADVNADAIMEGNGGKIIVWGDDSAKVYGTLSARGGLLSGDGGLIETSGENFLDIAGIGIDASAPQGLAGTWLLDPYNVTVSSSNTVFGVLTAGGTFTPNASGANVRDVDINTKLNAGTSVNIKTTGAGAEAGNITVDNTALISKTAGGNATLTLTALGDILIQGMIGATAGALKVVFNAVGNVTVSNTVTTNGGAFTSTGVNFNNTGGAISTGGGAVTVTHTGSAALGDISSANGVIAIASGVLGVTLAAAKLISAGNSTLAINGGGGAIDLSTGTLTTASISANAVKIQNAAAIKLSNINAAGGTLVLGLANDVTGTVSQNAATAITADIVKASTANDVTLDSAANVINKLGTFNIGANTLTLQNSAALAQTGVITAGTLNLANTAGDSNLSTSTNQIAHLGTVEATGRTFSVRNGQALDQTGVLTADTFNLTNTSADTDLSSQANLIEHLGTVNVGTKVFSLQNGQALDQSGVLTAGVFNLNNTAGTTDLSSQVNKITSLGTIDAAGQTFSLRNSVALNQSGVLTADTLNLTNSSANTDFSTQINFINHLGVINAAGRTFSLRNGQDLDQTGSLTTSKLLLTGSGNFTLDNALNDAGTLAADVAGALIYTDANTLTVGTVGAVNGIRTAGSDVTLNSGGKLTLANDMDAGTGIVTFNSANGVTENNGTKILADELLLTGTGTFTLNQAGNDVVELTASLNGVLTYRDATDLTICNVGGVLFGITTTGNDVALTAGGLIHVEYDINAGAGDVALTSANADINGAGVLTGAMVDLNAAAGIGNAGALNASASALSADTLGGAIAIVNSLATAVNVTSLTTGTGTIAFNQAGGGNLTVNSVSTTNGTIGVTVDSGDLTAVSVTAGTVAAFDGDVNLTTTTSGNLFAGSVSALNDTATLTSAGMIQDTDAPSNNTANVRAGTIDLNTNGADIGTLANYFDVTPSNVWNASTNGGAAYVRCIGSNCGLGLVDVGSGTFYHSVAGTLKDGNDDVFGEFEGGQVNIIAGGAVLQATQGIGEDLGGGLFDGIEMQLSDYNGVAESDGRLEASGGTGGIYIANANNTAGFGLTVGDIGALTNGLSAQDEIVLLSGSPLTINSDVFSTGGGDIVLAALGNTASDDLTVNADVKASGGAGGITLMAGDTVNVGAASTVSAASSGYVEIYAGEDAANQIQDQDGNTGVGGGSVFLADGSVVSSVSGTIYVDAADSVAIASLRTGNNGFFAVDVLARAGAITDNGDTDADIVTGASGTAFLSADLGIGSGDAIDTRIGKLVAENFTLGSIQIQELAAGGNLDLIVVNQVAAGADIDIRTENGTLKVLSDFNGGFGAGAIDGKVTLYAGDQDLSGSDHLRIENIVIQNHSDMLLKSDNDVIYSAAGASLNFLGDTTVEAGRDIQMADGSLAGSDDGEIHFDAGRDITVGSVDTLSDSLTAVTLNAGGRISDGGDTNLDVLTGSNGRAILTAATGIGNGNALETDMGQLDVSNTASGAIQIDEDTTGGDLDLIRVQQQGAGAVTIRTLNGDLTVLDLANGGAGVSVQAGVTTLSAQGTGSNDDLFIQNTVMSAGGKINLDSLSRDVRFTAEGDVSSNGGEIEVSAVRDIQMTDGATANAGSGIIDFDSGRDAILGSVQTTSNAATAVDINAGRAIVDGGDTDTDIVTGVSGRATLRAADGIGDTDALDTQIGVLHAVNTNTSAILVDELAAGGNLDIRRVDQQGAGDVVIRTLDGTLTVAAAGSGGLGVSAQSGETTLFAQDMNASGTDHLAINHTVTSTSGKINLDSENDVLFSVAGDVTTTSGEIEVDAAGFLTMADNGANSTILNAGSGHIDLDAGQDINLASVRTTSTDNDAVSIVSRGGAIIDGGDTDGFNVRTGALVEDPAVFDGGLLLSAATGIGRRADLRGGLETKAGGLAAENTSGDIQIFNTGALNIMTLTDAAVTSLGFAGAGTVTGVSVQSFLGAIIFITAASPMLITSPVLNNAGGDISLYSFGSLPTDTMTVSANVQSVNGNGDIRMVSGSDMMMDPGTVISTQGDGVTSGTGQIFIGAGYDATGKAANEPVTPGLNLLAPSTTLLDTPGNTAANLTMDDTSRIWTENGNILVDVQNTFTAGRVDADGNANAGITDGVRGDITTFSRNGSTLDAEAPNVGNLNFVANVLTMFSGGTIGLSNNPIEFDAPIFNASAIGSIFVTAFGPTLVNISSSAGSVSLTGLADIILGNIFAPEGDVGVTAGGSILSQGGGDTRIVAKDTLRLNAGNVIGTAENSINVQLNNPGTLFLSAGASINGLSTNVKGNFSSLSVSFLNTPPGLALVNGVAVAGQLLPILTTSVSTIFTATLPLMLAQFGQFDGRNTADFPGRFNMTGFGTPTPLPIDTTALDGIALPEQLPPRVVPIPRPVVPAPEPEPIAETKPAELPEEKPVVQQPATEPEQETIPLDEDEELPPAVVPIPPAPQSTLGGELPDQAEKQEASVSGPQQ